MKRILIASVAVLGLAGVAAAQQAPMLQGNYSANVLDTYNGNGTASTAQGKIDYSSTASIDRHSVPAEQPSVPATANFNYAR